MSSFLAQWATTWVRALDRTSGQEGCSHPSLALAHDPKARDFRALKSTRFLETHRKMRPRWERAQVFSHLVEPKAAGPLEA